MATHKAEQMCKNLENSIFLISREDELSVIMEFVRLVTEPSPGLINPEYLVAEQGRLALWGGCRDCLGQRNLKIAELFEHKGNKLLKLISHPMLHTGGLARIASWT
jgi:hypothetical protein